MCHWGKVVCVINPWNLAVSQSNKSCSVCSISFDFEHPFVPNQSPIFWYLHFVYFSPDSPVDQTLYFLPDCNLPILSFFFNWAMPSFLNVLGSVGPDVTAEIRQVSCIQSSIVNSAHSIDSYLGDIISFVWLLVLPNSSFLDPIFSMSITSFFHSSVLLPSPLFLISSVSLSLISSVSLSSWVWSSSSCE